MAELLAGPCGKNRGGGKGVSSKVLKLPQCSCALAWLVLLLQNTVKKQPAMFYLCNVTCRKHDSAPGTGCIVHFCALFERVHVRGV